MQAGASLPDTSCAAAMPKRGIVKRKMESIMQTIPVSRVLRFMFRFFMFVILAFHKIRRPGFRATERLDKCCQFLRGYIQPTNHTDNLHIFQFGLLLLQFPKPGLLDSDFFFYLVDLRQDFLQLVTQVKTSLI